MTNIQDIQDEIIAVYETITVPNSLGLPTGHKHEPLGGFASTDLPVVVVTRGIQTSSIPLSSDSSQVAREFIVDLFTYIVDDDDPINETNRDNTSDCIESVLASFPIHGIKSVQTNLITAVFGDVELYPRDTAEHDYIGIRFRHAVEYFQIMT